MLFVVLVIFFVGGILMMPIKSTPTPHMFIKHHHRQCISICSRVSSYSKPNAKLVNFIQDTPRVCAVCNQ